MKILYCSIHADYQPDADKPQLFSKRLEPVASRSGIKYDSLMKKTVECSDQIAILSDTHGELPEVLLSALQGVTAIIHAGDFADGRVLAALEEIAPVIGVRGNCDTGVSGGLPLTAVFYREQCAFMIVHRLQDVDTASLRGQVTGIICGHTHVPAYAGLNGLVVFNPGSPVSPRGGSAPSFGMLELYSGGWRLEHRYLTG